VCIVVVEGVGVEPSALTWLSALSAAMGGREHRPTVESASAVLIFNFIFYLYF
jgi:hypothetical protein